MMSRIGASSRVSKRRSRLVTMPTTFLPSTTGSPDILFARCSSIASRTVMSCVTVIGSRSTPASWRLTFSDLGGLLLRRQVLVDDADAALLRQRDGQPRLGHRVHRGGDQRDVQRDVAGELGRELNVAGEDRRVGGDEQHVIEGQRLLNQPHSVLMTQKRSIPTPVFSR